MPKHNLFASLKLVHAPISNLLADRLLEDSPNAASILSRSKLYMIVARPALRFAAWRHDEGKGLVLCEILHGSKSISVAIDVQKLLPRSNPELESFRVSANDKMIEFHEPISSSERVSFFWLTPDKALYSLGHGADWISSKGTDKEFSSFDLLYIGKSGDDAFRRLVANPHHARLKILTNELRREEQGRLTEEVCFLFFDIEPLYISSYAAEEDFDELALQLMQGDHEDIISPDRLVSDAERAFIKVLDTKYNKMKYKSYPAVKDGLSSSHLDGYVYIINEDIRLNVGSIAFDCSFDPFVGMHKDADSISVSDGRVRLWSKSAGTETVI